MSENSTHTYILNAFKELFPNVPVSHWWKKGEHSIRIRGEHRRDYIFTYIGEDNWKIESVLYFMEANKEE